MESLGSTRPVDQHKCLRPDARNDHGTVARHRHDGCTKFERNLLVDRYRLSHNSEGRQVEGQGAKVSLRVYVDDVTSRDVPRVAPKDVQRLDDPGPGGNHHQPARGLPPNANEHAPITGQAMWIVESLA